MRKVRKRERGKKRKQKEREKKTRSGMHNRETELAESRARWFRLSVLYYRKWERERRGKRSRIKKETGQRRGETTEEKCRRAKRDENHMLNECACRLYARLEIRLQVQTNTRDTEKNGKSHTHVNILRNENAEVKSINKET